MICVNQEPRKQRATELRDSKPLLARSGREDEQGSTVNLLGIVLSNINLCKKQIRKKANHCYIKT